MVKIRDNGLRVGDRVKVLWGTDEVLGTVTEIWGSPPAHVRVALELEEDGEPEVLLLNPKVVRRAS
jgi:hypothetical protein